MIKDANKNIDDFINNKAEVYRFEGELKPGIKDDDYISTYVSQIKP